MALKPLLWKEVLMILQQSWSGCWGKGKEISWTFPPMPSHLWALYHLCWKKRVGSHIDLGSLCLCRFSLLCTPTSPPISLSLSLSVSVSLFVSLSLPLSLCLSPSPHLSLFPFSPPPSPKWYKMPLNNEKQCVNEQNDVESSPFSESMTSLSDFECSRQSFTSDFSSKSSSPDCE